MTLHDAALAYATAGWEVFPLRGKIPAIAKADGGNGVLDATTDLEQIEAWWSKHPNANIGGRVPAGVVVVDIDPRSGGLESWIALIAEHDEVSTRIAWSGREDGGRHLYFHHPGGRMHASVGTGLDVKTHAGYTVLPPSIHPDSGRPYRWDDPTAPINAAPEWLIHLLRHPVAVPKQPTAQPSNYTGDSIADWFTATRTWADVLTPHGWTLKTGDGDTDGSQWRHPTATSPWSATIRHGCLFVYTPNTPLEQTTTQSPHGYTRFRAYAVLDHRGDLTAAARAARTLHQAA
jgi:hypothetical protein